jgi:hypothetical protein
MYRVAVHDEIAVPITVADKQAEQLFFMNSLLSILIKAIQGI